MRVLKPFDPWKSKLCSCGEKLSFNPYTGCAHCCDYCYATYIPRFWEVREKKNLLRNLEKDLTELEGGEIISMSNSSDPYPPIEKEREITRKCLKLLKEYNAKVLVVTKSDIVLRDMDLLSELDAVVSMSITGCDQLEKFAPPTEKRISAFRQLSEAVPVVLRFDPIVPFLNESRLEIIELCKPDHVVASTLKLKPDSFRRISETLPWLRIAFQKIYFEEGEKIGGYYYAKRELRKSILQKVENFCEEIGISCAFCREGLAFKAKSCDGKHIFGRRFKNIFVGDGDGL